MSTKTHNLHVAFCELPFAVTQNDVGRITAIAAPGLPEPYVKAMESVNAALQRGVSLHDLSIRMRAIRDMIDELMRVERGHV